MFFDVGDYLVGIRENGYSITNDNMLKGVVVDGESLGWLADGKIWVKILEHKNGFHIGEVYDVDPKCFIPYENEETYSIRLV